MAGRETEIVGIKCNDFGIKILKFLDPIGPVFKYDPPNGTSFGDQPMISKYLPWYNLSAVPTQVYRGILQGYN